MQGGLALNVIINDSLSISALDALIPNNDLTGRSGRQRQLFCYGSCTFKIDIESIPICDGGTPIHVTKVALDYIEVAASFEHNDSSGVPNATKQWEPESSWHRVCTATCQFQLVMIESGLFEDENLGISFYKVANPYNVRDRTRPITN